MRGEEQVCMTGEKMKVPAKYMPHFKTGKELRERVIFAAEK